MPHFRMHYMHGFSFLLSTPVLIFDCRSIAPRSILLVLQSGMLSAKKLFVLPSEMGCLRWGLFQSLTPTVLLIVNIRTHMSTTLLNGRLVYMKMVLIVVPFSTITNMGLRTNHSWPGGRDLIDHNHLFQAPLSLLKPSVREPPLPQTLARVRRGKGRFRLPECLQKPCQFLRRVEEVFCIGDC